MNKISLIITSAGTGKRFGYHNGKQFYPFKGIPLIIYTIKAFSEFNFSQRIITIEKNKIQFLKSLLQTHKIHNYSIIEGGSSRQESVQKAFQSLDSCKTVFIHDGARINIKPSLIKSLLKASKNHSAVIPGIPVIDTIKELDQNHFVKNTPSRSKLTAIQTPQVFDYNLLKKAYQNVHNLKITDEAKLFEHLKIPVKVIQGDPSNIKITYPQDLEILNILNS